jgi:hypothetical protein
MGNGFKVVIAALAIALGFAVWRLDAVTAENKTLQAAALAVCPAVSVAAPPNEPAAPAAAPTETHYDQGVAAFSRGDYAAAYLLLRPLADQGDAGAQEFVGEIYSEDLSPLHDDRQAAFWHRKAAEQGDAAAQNNLGYMYEIGQGVAQDYVQAYMWRNLAVAGATNFPMRDTALKARAGVAAKMTSAQIAEAEKLAREWKPTN